MIVNEQLEDKYSNCFELLRIKMRDSEWLLLFNHLILNKFNFFLAEHTKPYFITDILNI